MYTSHKGLAKAQALVLESWIRLGTLFPSFITDVAAPESLLVSVRGSWGRRWVKSLVVVLSFLDLGKLGRLHRLPLTRGKSDGVQPGHDTVSAFGH